MCTLHIPERITSSKEGFQLLAQLYYDIEKLAENNPQIIVDFSKCKFFDGNLCATMGAIFDKFSKKSEILLKISKRSKVSQVLSRNNFLRAWKVETNEQNAENYVEYSRFGIADTDGFKKYIDKQLINKQKFPEHSEEVGKQLVESLYEIYANARMHGKTDYVYSCGEYKEVASTFEMLIVDLGQTIPYNVNSFFEKRNKDKVSSCDAIKWALKKGNTTKDNPGGLGLSLLKEFIELNQGALQMVSASGFVEYAEGTTREYDLGTDFPGTIVNVKFNFSDPNRYWMASETLDLNNLL